MSVEWPAMQSKRMLLKTIYRSEELALNHNLTRNRFVAPVTPDPHGMHVATRD